jgi:putative membrane protein
MMYWYGGPGGWSYALMALSMVVFWGLVTAVGIFVVRQLAADRRSPVPIRPHDPMLILHERYARGEINETEYRQQLKVLKGE